MNFKELLQKSKETYDMQPRQVQKIVSTNIFTEGGVWMANQMQILEPRNRISSDKPIHFNSYGFLKYGICLVIFVISFLLFFNVHPVTTPLSIIVFYFCEVHSVFLFPLLIDKETDPIWKNIRIIYTIGVIKSMFRVIRLACFMLFGLLYLKDPFRNWHIGCLFILIWYQHDVRNRLQR